MKRFVFISCLLTASSAIFFPFINFPGQKQSMMNVCIYSVNPARYQPKCFLCPSTVYPNVLQTCVRASSIPSNITFTQANCIEQNCAIGRGKRSVDLHQPENLLEDYENRVLVDPLQKKETDRTGKEKSEQHDSVIVGTEEFFASDYEYDELETEMDEMDS